MIYLLPVYSSPKAVAPTLRAVPTPSSVRYSTLCADFRMTVSRMLPQPKLPAPPVEDE